MIFLLYAIIGAAGLYIFLHGSETPSWVAIETVDGKAVQTIPDDPTKRSVYALSFYGNSNDDASGNRDAITASNMKTLDDSATSLGAALVAVQSKYKDPRVVVSISEFAKLIDAMPPMPPTDASGNPAPGTDPMALVASLLPDANKLPDTITIYLLDKPDAFAMASKGSSYAIIGPADHAAPPPATPPATSTPAS